MRSLRVPQFAFLIKKKKYSLRNPLQCSGTAGLYVLRVYRLRLLILEYAKNEWKFYDYYKKDDDDEGDYCLLFLFYNSSLKVSVKPRRSRAHTRSQWGPLITLKITAGKMTELQQNNNYKIKLILIMTYIL